MNFLSQPLYLAETVIRLVLLAFLLRGSFRKYLVFSLYVTVAFVVDVMQSTGYYYWGLQSRDYRQLYWTANITMDLMLFWVVSSLTYAALKDNRLRRKAGQILGVIAVGALALPFLILPDHHSSVHGHFTSQYFNHVSQILNFAAAAMNLVLWGALLADRRRDPQLVSMSIGMGVLTAAEAIVWGARQWLAPEHRWTVDTFDLIATLVSLLIWCWVFRPKSQRRSVAQPSALTTPT